MNISKNAGNMYGYARVSTREQNLDRQIAALKAAGVPAENIFTDKRSGKNFNRPGWRSLLKRLRPDDILVVKSIDRFGRDYEEIIAQWEVLSKRKMVHMRILDMPLLDTTIAHGLLAVFITNIVLQILSFVADMERRQIKSRQREGIAAAKLRGVKFGRPRIELPPRFNELCGDYLRHELTLRFAAESCGMSQTTFWRRCKLMHEDL